MGNSSTTPLPTASATHNASATPAISIVLPVYRERPEILARTLKSIAGQTFTDYELIVVVDDPENATNISLVQQAAKDDHRIRCSVNERNMGVWPSYNRGISLARGEFLAIHDADDESLPQRLQILHDFLVAHPEIDVVGAALDYVNESDKKSLMVRYYPTDVSAAMKRYCPLAHATTLRRRNLHDRFGTYDESPAFKHAADYELWIRWFLQGVRFANVPEVVYKYYQSDANFKNLHVRRILRDTIRIKRRYASQLKFGIADYCFLGAEWAASLLPTWAIMQLFYQYNSWRVKRAAQALAQNQVV